MSNTKGIFVINDYQRNMKEKTDYLHKIMIRLTASVLHMGTHTQSKEGRERHIKRSFKKNPAKTEFNIQPLNKLCQ